MLNIENLVKNINKFADKQIKEAKRDSVEFKKIISDYLNAEACTIQNRHIIGWAIITICICFAF